MTTEHSDGPGQAKDADELQHDKDTNQNRTEIPAPFNKQLKGVETQSAAAKQSTEENHEANKDRAHICKRLYRDLKENESIVDLFLTAVLVVATTIAAFNAVEANRVATRAATAAERAAKSAEDAYALAKAGETSANEVANATKKTAEATEVTANAAKESAEAAKATAEGMESTSQSIATAIELAQQANITAEKPQMPPRKVRGQQ